MIGALTGEGEEGEVKNHELSSWSPVPQYITGLSIAYRLLDKIQIMI